MNRIVLWGKKNFIFTSPLLVAFYTVFFLYAENISEFKINVLFLPVAIALLFAGIIFFVTQLIVKKVEAATLIALILVFVSLSYIRIASFINTLPLQIGKIAINIDLATCFILFVILGIISFVVIKYQTKLREVNKIITVMTLGLVLFSAFTIAKFEIQNGRLFTKDTKNTKMQINEIPYTGARPDIYYFIFDRYAGPRSLKEQYGFDNSPFLNFLKKKGFYVPSNSTTNYPKTFVSLASSLNMEYLDFMTKQTNGGVSSDESLVTPLIRNNKVVKFLKERGYSYIHVGSWWEATAYNPNANKNFVLHYGVYPFADEFTTGYLNTTIAASILKATFRDPMAVSVEPQNNLHRKMIFYELDALKDIPQMPGPKFVFFHILFPHDPFVLDQNCKPVSEETVDEKMHQENYINQLKCANTKIETLLNQILSNSKTPPVIIFQADEGPFPMNSPLPPKQSWVTADDTALREKFPILNAYYFPGIKDTQLYETITPVNSFRILFNDYFGTNYPLLPDTNYIFQDENNYYKFIDVTQKVK